MVAIEAAVAEAQERRGMPWRGSSELMPVVELPLELVLLNPRSHRIRAQLESHQQADVVARDPWSAKAQAIIAGILRELSENFEDLKRNLQEEGQLEAGMMSRFGLLVNANRRAVALRDGDAAHVRVIVLPDDATDPEIDGLELQLQMQLDFRESYTFTNRLLFVEDLIVNQNRTVDDVARALNLAASSDPRALARGKAKVEQHTRVLAMIRAIQRRSGGCVPLTSFDAQEIALEELDDRLREEDNPAVKGELYEIRLLGLLSEVPYRDLRHLSGDTLEAHVMPLLAEDDLLGDIVEHLGGDPDGGQEDDGLEGLDLLDDEPESVITARIEKIVALNNLIAMSHGSEDLLVPAADGAVRRVGRDLVVTRIYDSLRAAANEVRTTDRHEDQLQAPANRVAEAERKLQLAASSYADVAERSGFDTQVFTAALDKVLERLQGLADAAGHDLDC